MVKAEFIVGGKTIPVHFNPSEYNISSEAGETRLGDSRLSSERNERLAMQLVFDTYTPAGQLWSALPVIGGREDVRAYTDQIAGLVARKKDKPLVTFSWGSVNFKGVVISVSQKFTMFMDDGKPVRAVLDVVMQGAEDDSGDSAENTGWSDNSWKNNLNTPKARNLLEKR